MHSRPGSRVDQRPSTAQRGDGAKKPAAAPQTTGGAADRPSEAPIARSETRLKRASVSTDPPQLEDLLDAMQASLDAAIGELDSLELPEAEAALKPLAPPQRMPKGMPPLPFRSALPSNMPPLPGASSSKSAATLRKK